MLLMCSQPSVPACLARSVHRHRHRSWPALILLAYLNASCSNGVTADTAATTPDKQFVLRNLHIEQRRDGKILWSGIAQSSDGDLSVNDVQDLTLNYPTDSGTTITLTATQAHLDFEQGEAWFEPLHLADAQGAHLAGSQGRYQDASNILSADGPIVCKIPQQLDVTGTQAQVDLKEQILILDGPIVGRWYPPQALIPFEF